MNKQQKAEFLAKNYLYLKYKDNGLLVKFDKLDTEKNFKIDSAGFIRRLQSLAGKYWITCTYKIKNVTNKALFGIDTTLTKIDTAYIK